MMSEKTAKVMNKHLKTAEKYISELQEATDKSGIISAMKKCAADIRKQYPELEEVADEFNTLMVTNQATEEIKIASMKTGECFGRRTVELLPKMAPYMADDDYRAAQAELDSALNDNPLFKGAMQDDKALLEVSHTFATAMNSMAEKLHLETAETDLSLKDEIVSVISDFDALSKRFAAAVEKADTSRKLVTAIDGFVAAVKKMTDRMNAVAEPMRIMSAQKLLPDTVTELLKSIGQTLGKELTVILKDKTELMGEPKVKKAVGKLGDILESVPF